MNKTKVILVDDEPRGLKVLELLCEGYPDQLEIVASCKGPEEAIECINQRQPDLLIMDIQMPGRNAFDVLSAVRVQHVEIIFATAYNHYALKAFQYSAVDYLLKPIDEELFNQAIHRALERIHSRQVNLHYDALRYNLEHWRHPDEMKICISDSRGFRVVRISDIVYCEAESCYTNIHLENKTTITSSRTLAEYDELLDEKNFIRIHRSYIVNIQHVKEYQRGEGGTVIMDNGKKLELSRRKKEEFIAKMKGLYRV